MFKKGRCWRVLGVKPAAGVLSLHREAIASLVGNQLGFPHGKLARDVPFRAELRHLLCFARSLP